MSGGIPIGMEMESQGCIDAYKYACRQEHLRKRKRGAARRRAEKSEKIRKAQATGE